LHKTSNALWVGIAERLSADLAAHGLVIVSGMARGVGYRN